MSECKTCGGKGKVQKKKASLLFKVEVLPCPYCYGTGKDSLEKDELDLVSRTIAGALLRESLSEGNHLRKIPNPVISRSVTKRMFEIADELQTKEGISNEL